MVVEAWGYNTASKCGLVTAPWPPTDGLENKNSNTLNKSVKKFDTSLKSSNKARISFKNYLSFRIFQKVSENTKTYMPADYQFYKDKEYYYPAKIGIINRIIAGILLKVLFFMMRDLGPGNLESKPG